MGGSSDASVEMGTRWESWQCDAEGLKDAQKGALAYFVKEAYCLMNRQRCQERFSILRHQNKVNDDVIQI